MTNEIKEILYYLKNDNKYIEDYGYEYKRISLKNTKILLDYITNLQQRIDKTIKYCEESSKTIKSEYFSDVLKILKGEDE